MDLHGNKNALKIATADTSRQVFIGITPLEANFCRSFEQAGVALALVAMDGQFICVNSVLCDLLGYEEAELLSGDLPSIAAGEDVVPNADFMRRFEAQDLRPVQLHGRYLHKSGREIWAMLNASVVRDPAGKPLHHVIHIEDQTERRRASWLENDRRQVLEMVARDQPLPSILHQLVRLVERQVPGMYACIMLLQDGSIQPFAPSLPPNLTEALNRRPVSFAARLATAAPGQGSPPRVVDVESDPVWEGFRAEGREAGVKCCWAAMVSGGDSVPLGILLIFSPEQRRPTAGEYAAIEIAARLATISVEHHLTTRQLAHLVRHDPLTGLPNRILFEDRLAHSLQTARRSGRPLALLALDLDRFKQVNDTYGHQAGDSLLQQFSHRVSGRLRESDTMARVGGDEFMLILSDITDRNDAEIVANRIRASLSAAPFDIAGRAHTASTSIGIAIYPADGDDAMLLQRAADVAMYRVKEQGRPEDPPSDARPSTLVAPAA